MRFPSNGSEDGKMGNLRCLFGHRGGMVAAEGEGSRLINVGLARIPSGLATVSIRPVDGSAASQAVPGRGLFRV